MRGYREAMAAYITLAGRTSRLAFWQYVLTVMLLNLIAMGLDWGLHTGGWLSSLVTLVHLIPSATVTARRLHDVGRSGWWWWINFTGVGVIFPLLIWLTRRGQPGPNRYGPALGQVDTIISRELEPAFGANASGQPDATERHFVYTPTAPRSDSAAILIMVVVAFFLLFGGGIGAVVLTKLLRLNLGSGCSDPAVTDVVAQLMREHTLADLADTVDLPKAKISFDAIRTRSTGEEGTECAAQAVVIMAANPGLKQQNSSDLFALLDGRHEYDVSYRVETTDDGRPYVTLNTPAQ